MYYFALVFCFLLTTEGEGKGVRDAGRSFTDSLGESPLRVLDVYVEGKEKKIRPRLLPYRFYPGQGKEGSTEGGAVSLSVAV